MARLIGCVSRDSTPAHVSRRCLGGPEHGRWLLAPVAGMTGVQRRYRDDSLVLETDFETERGSVRVIDFMPLSDRALGRRADRRGSERPGRDAHGIDRALRLRLHRAVGAPRRKDLLVITAGPDTLELAASVDVRRREYEDRGAVFRARRPARILRAQLPAVALSRRGPDRCRRRL